MKINVILITYNHAKYIKQAIESVLMQQTTFDFELIIADDCSTDETLSIIEKYKDETVVKFRFLNTPKNLGLVKNYQRSFASTDSEYVAVLEGDDYWTDPYKLQKHVDFLDKHYECVMSFNRNLTLIQNTGRFQLDNDNLKAENKYITAQKLASGNCIGNFSMCVYRKSVIDKINPNIYNMNIADWMLNLAVAQFGLIAQLGEIMSVYRVHENGEWSKMSRLRKLKVEFECAESYNQYFDKKYDAEFQSLQHYIRLEMDKLENVKRFNWREVKQYCPPVLIILLKLLIPKCKK